MTCTHIISGNAFETIGFRLLRFATKQYALESAVHGYDTERIHGQYYAHRRCTYCKFSRTYLLNLLTYLFIYLPTNRISYLSAYHVQVIHCFLLSSNKQTFMDYVIRRQSTCRRRIRNVVTEHYSYKLCLLTTCRASSHY